MRQDEAFMLAGALIVLAFGLGLLAGGHIERAHKTHELALGQRCMEQMGEVNHAVMTLAAAVAEVNHESSLFLGGRPLHTVSLESGVQGVFKIGEKMDSRLRGNGGKGRQ